MNNERIERIESALELLRNEVKRIYYTQREGEGEACPKTKEAIEMTYIILALQFHYGPEHLSEQDTAYLFNHVFLCAACKRRIGDILYGITVEDAEAIANDMPPVSSMLNAVVENIMRAMKISAEEYDRERAREEKKRMDDPIG